MKKDKQKVLDEVWTEERIRDFLAVEPADNVDKDFHMLLKAYQSMRAEDFEIFVTLFCGEGRDINATDASGRSVLSYVREHRNSEDYAGILQAKGAKD